MMPALRARDYATAASQPASDGAAAAGGGMPIIGCGIAGVVAGVAWFGVTSDMATDDVDVGAGACGCANGLPH